MSGPLFRIMSLWGRQTGWLLAGLAVSLAALATIGAGWLWSLPVWLVALFVLQFFRDPPRQIPTAPNLVLSPADGRIVSIVNVNDPYLKREAVKISVFMNVFNVHSNRSPVDGEILQAWYNPGAFVNAALDKASTDNERNALWLRTAGGADVTCVQVAGLIARRILCYVKAGDKLARGERYGFIRFGSRVDVYLPPGTRIIVQLGDKVSATSTVLAELAAPTAARGARERENAHAPAQGTPRRDEPRVPPARYVYIAQCLHHGRPVLRLLGDRDGDEQGIRARRRIHFCRDGAGFPGRPRCPRNQHAE